MAKFELGKNTIKLEINGQNFVVNLTNEILTNCDNVRDEAAKILDSFEEKNNAKEVLVSACNTLTKGIEDILGVGSVSKIFGKNAITLFDLTDILVFVRTEISSMLKKKINAYTSINKK